MQRFSSIVRLGLQVTRCMSILLILALSRIWGASSCHSNRNPNRFKTTACARVPTTRISFAPTRIIIMVKLKSSHSDENHYRQKWKRFGFIFFKHSHLFVVQWFRPKTITPYSVRIRLSTITEVLRTPIESLIRE